MAITPLGTSPSDARSDAPPSDVGRHLRSVRKARGLSRSEVARSAGLTRRELAAYERGRSVIPDSDLWCLAGSCGVDVDELLPARDRLGVSPGLGALTVGEHVRPLPPGSDTDGVLREYVAMVHELRNLPAGTTPPMRAEDLATLADALGGTPDMIEARIEARTEAPVEAPIQAPIEAPIQAPIETRLDDYAASPTPPVAEPEPEPEPDPATVAPGPEPDARSDAPDADRFVPAGAEWQFGGGYPAVAVTDGTLTMRRADVRWALADLEADGDFTVRATVDFTSGVGFGILFRAATDRDERISGYSFDLDPVYSGGGFLVRQWHESQQRWKPIAHSAVAESADLYGPHVVEVSVHHEELVARVDSRVVLTVDDLSRATIDTGHAPCRGTRVGVQAWSTTEVVIDALMVAHH